MRKSDKIWAYLLHLSYNMWWTDLNPNLQLSMPLWNDAINEMHKDKLNMVVIDVGDAVKFDSHPEIAVNNAWTPSQLNDEVKRLKSLGIEAIPKMNFSAGHDDWLKEYSKMVSTEEYYKVCADLIAETCDIFENPRFFHLGMDEESDYAQLNAPYIVIRKNDLWWKDFYFLVNEVEKHNSRSWIWSDYMLWNEPEQFFKKMPKSVLQSNWCYYQELELTDPEVKKYIDLYDHGYDQIPTASYFQKTNKNIEATVRIGKKYLNNEHLLGFLQTIWYPTTEQYREDIIEGIRLTGEVKRMKVF